MCLLLLVIIFAWNVRNLYETICQEDKVLMHLDMNFGALSPHVAEPSIPQIQVAQFGTLRIFSPSPKTLSTSLRP